MKVLLLNCFPSEENNRAIPILEFHEKKGDEVKLLTTNFNHYSKERYIVNRNNVVQFNVLKYKKNISARRILSHFQYSYKVYNYVLQFSPQVVYAKIPPNFLLFFLKRAKKKSNFLLVADIYDLWPESMPGLKSKGGLLKIVYNLWKDLRDKNVTCVDYTIYECSLYQEYVKNNGKYRNLYLCRKSINTEMEDKNFDNDLIRLGYIGNIGHLLDIDLLLKFVRALAKEKKVEIQLIGSGATKKHLISELEKICYKVVDNGVVFDECEKVKIFSRCDFGINMMKKELMIGLSNKSVDYFSMGVPIINNVSYDTWKLVDRYKAGFNIDDDSFDKVIHDISIIKEEDMNLMRGGALKLFRNHFSLEAFSENYEAINAEVSDMLCR